MTKRHTSQVSREPWEDRRGLDRGPNFPGETARDLEK